MYRPVGRAVTRSSLEGEVWGSNLGPVKSNSVLPTVRHCCDISLKRAVLHGRTDAEMGPANSLHASAYCSKYNERFDFDLTKLCVHVYSESLIEISVFFSAASWVHRATTVTLKSILSWKQLLVSFRKIWLILARNLLHKVKWLIKPAKNLCVYSILPVVLCFSVVGSKFFFYGLFWTLCTQITKTINKFNVPSSLLSGNAFWPCLKNKTIFFTQWAYIYFF